MDVFDIAMNILVFGLFCMLFILPYFLRKKANKILDDYLKNEKIVKLLESAKYSDFAFDCQGRSMLLNNSNYVRLLKEYVGNDKQFSKYGLRILKIYYSDAAFKAKEENYIMFKQNMENKK